MGFFQNLFKPAEPHVQTVYVPPVPQHLPKKLRQQPRRFVRNISRNHPLNSC